MNSNNTTKFQKTCKPKIRKEFETLYTNWRSNNGSAGYNEFAKLKEQVYPTGLVMINENNRYKTDFQFPDPDLSKTVAINMMPIVVEDLSTYTDDTLRYRDIIKVCSHVSGLNNKKCYLTIHESWVAPGLTQRRKGLHVESPRIGEGKNEFYYWGQGECLVDRPDGGIFMASNVTGSCEVYNVKIDTDAIGLGGDIEHLRSALPKDSRKLLKAGELVWITDRTPHSSLPVDHLVYRQFFRLVTSNISAWYSQHSTANPLGCEVGENILIINENKFTSDATAPGSDTSTSTLCSII